MFLGNKTVAICIIVAVTHPELDPKTVYLTPFALAMMMDLQLLS